MVVFTVGELDIQFPFVPYDVQKELMKGVVQCVENKENGLLESPTGTGKTLSLLCAALAWQKKQLKQVIASTNMTLGNRPMAQQLGCKSGGNCSMETASDSLINKVPKIIYASRTHAQLSQAAQELKRSFYASTKAVVMGSRDVMCIHDGVSRLTTSSAKIMACHVQVKSRTCNFYNNVNQKKDEIGTVVMDKPVMDIEDLVATGKRNRLCPFFMSRELVKDAHIVFMPYNYLMDPKLRSSHGVDLKNCIIILDEGHNIAKTCEESVSFEIKSSTIAKCIQEVTQTMNEFNEITQQIGSNANAVMQDINMGSLVALKQSFLQLEQALDAFKLGSDPAGSFVAARDVLTAIFQNGFPPSTFPGMISNLDAISSFQAMSSRDSTGCDAFASMLRILSSQAVFLNPFAFADSFRVFLVEEKRHIGSLKVIAKDNGGNVPKVFNFWCFNPAIGLEMMLQYGPRCIILASGTLSPLPFLESELQVSFPVKLSNPHIIGDNQLFATILKTGPAPKCAKLTSAFNNRTNPDYLSGLGEVIVSTCSVVPKGVLVFFPSYTLMDGCVTAWKTNGVFDKIASFKAVYVEPRGKYEFNQIMSNYYQSVKMSNGACLMAVCRGKVSEGLDFADDNGRAVIITGIPYAPLHDPHVQAKKTYLDSKLKTTGVTGANWYQMEAVRALNQAVGRIIRHAQDFGAVLLCDERFDYPMVLNNLSPWLGKRLKKGSNYSETMTQLSQFFKTPSKTYGRVYPPQKQATGSFQTTSSHLKPYTKTKAFEPSDSQDDEMDCDISSLYAKTSPQKEPTATSSDLFSKLGSLEIRPAVDFVKETKLDSSRDVLSSSNSLRRAIPQIAKRSFSSVDSNNRVEKPKRIKMEIHKIQPYLPCTGDPIASSSSASSPGNNRSMDMDIDSPAEQTPEFRSAKGFSSWVKNDLTPVKYSRFIEVLKEFKVSKNVEKLGEELKILFVGEKFFVCLEGLKFVLHDSYNSLLQLNASYARENYNFR